MSSKIFLLFNGLVILYLIIRMFSGSRPGRPTPLNFEVKRYKWPQGEDLKSFKFGRAKENQEKSLNCHFQHEGITWDAFEVLGVPAGSDKESCWVAFSDLKRRKEGSPEFLSAAWAAIERHFSGK